MQRQRRCRRDIKEEEEEEGEINLGDVVALVQGLPFGRRTHSHCFATSSCIPNPNAPIPGPVRANPLRRPCRPSWRRPSVRRRRVLRLCAITAQVGGGATELPEPIYFKIVGRRRRSDARAEYTEKEEAEAKEEEEAPLAFVLLARWCGTAAARMASGELANGMVFVSTDAELDTVISVAGREETFSAQEVRSLV